MAVKNYVIQTTPVQIKNSSHTILTSDIASKLAEIVFELNSSKKASFAILRHFLPTVKSIPTNNGSP